MKRSSPFLLSAIIIMILASVQLFGITSNYATAKITMSIDSKIDGDDIRTEIDIDTPDNTRIDETETSGDDRVNIVAKTPRNGDGNDDKETEEKAAGEIEGGVKDVGKKCDPLLQEDLPEQGDAERCKDAINAAENIINSEQNDLPP